MLKVITGYMDGSTNVIKSIPCDAGSRTDICLVEVRSVRIVAIIVWYILLHTSWLQLMTRSITFFVGRAHHQELITLTDDQATSRTPHR